MLAEQAAALKAELLECLTGLVRPVIEEAAELRGWLVRATSFLRQATPASPKEAGDVLGSCDGGSCYSAPSPP